ncbi:MAG: hypothetical protein IJ809_02100 [Clostridia bacterium]|nr:hypothetical protein [Clostridia bacterium]
MKEAIIITMTVERSGKVMFGIVSEEGKYFYEDGTEVIRSIYGEKVQPRKVARHLKKYILNHHYSACSNADVPTRFPKALRKAIVVAA